MKKVVLSFDDGRLDTFTNAIQILKKYGLTATINIATDFVENETHYLNFCSADNKSMTREMVIETFNDEFEIACHGDKHNNSYDDIVCGIRKLKAWGVVKEKVGFASPYSAMTKDNCNDVRRLIDEGVVSYIRSGYQIRRKSALFKIGYFVEEILHSKYLFYLLNKEICRPIKGDNNFYIGVTTNNNTKFEQIKYLIEKVPDNSHVILILHSIISEESPGFGKDKWYMTIDTFNKLCFYLKQKDDVEVITNYELVNSKG